MRSEYPPIVTHPEVEKDYEIERARETEAMYYDYKIKREEMLSIFDEVKEFFDYEILEGVLDNFQIAEELKNKIKEHKSKSKHTILYEDFVKILEQDRPGFLKYLYSVLEKKEEGMFAESEVGKDENRKLIKTRAVGKFISLGNMLQHRFTPLRQELDKTPPDDLERIKGYVLANMPKVREAIKTEKEIGRGIRTAREAKSADIVRKGSEQAALYNVEEDTIIDFNSEMADIIKEMTGDTITFNIEQKYEEQGNVIDRELLPAYVHYTKKMKEWYRMLVQGKIVETGDVVKNIDEAMPLLKKNPPSIVYFHGDFGTGKTALAVHIS